MNHVNDKITDIYCSIMSKDTGSITDKINELLFSSSEQELRECGCDLYMLFRFYRMNCNTEGEDIAAAIDSLMNRIALYVVSLDEPRLVEIRNNDILNAGIFVESLSKLQEPVARIDNHYITEGYKHFTEHIYRDVNGLKYREIELPPPPGAITPGYELTNGLLMEREENLKLMFEEDEDE